MPLGRTGLLGLLSAGGYLFAVSVVVAQHHQHHEMARDANGMVMNNNDSVLPRDCEEISRDYEFAVTAGTEYAADAPGTIFGLSEHEHRVAPCSRITVTFINEDEVRHQWMVHGLPTYLYPGGMFHLEAAGGYRKTGTFIVPSDHKTYLVHCDLAQHMEKGMKAQLVVGRGSGDLWSVPTVSPPFESDAYLPANLWWWIAGSALAGFVLAGLALRRG